MKKEVREHVDRLLRDQMQRLREGESSRGMEAEIKTVSGIKHKEFVRLLINALKNPQVAPVAALLLEHYSASGAPDTAKSKLAKLYGAKSYEHRDELIERRREWFAIQNISNTGVLPGVGKQNEVADQTEDLPESQENEV